MKKSISIIAVGGALIVSGCGVQADVTGQISGGDETFSGVITNYKSHSGKIKVTTSEGAECESRFNRTGVNAGRSVSSKGTLKCSDGRRGPYTFNPRQTGGTGWGTLNGQSFSFEFER